MWAWGVIRLQTVPVKDALVFDIAVELIPFSDRKARTNKYILVGSDGQSHKTVSTNCNLFEEKGEPKRIEPRSFRLPA